MFVNDGDCRRHTDAEQHQHWSAVNEPVRVLTYAGNRRVNRAHLRDVLGLVRPERCAQAGESPTAVRGKYRLVLGVNKISDVHVNEEMEEPGPCVDTSTLCR